MAGSVPLSQNWFFNFDEDEEVCGKSFLLQVSLEDLSRNSLSDSVNPYVVLFRSLPEAAGLWRQVGKTRVIQDDISPSFPDGFRLFYDHSTDLRKDLIKVECRHSRGGPGTIDELIGDVQVSLYELLRTFGTRLKLELCCLRSKKNPGWIQFEGEALPSRSPCGGENILDVVLKPMVPPRDILPALQQSLISTSIFLMVSRQRDDMSWGAVYRSPYIKRGSGVFHSGRRAMLIPVSFKVLQKELVLGQTPKRKLLFQIVRRGRHRDPNLCIGASTVTAEDLLQDLEPDSSADVMFGDKIVGEFALISRKISCDEANRAPTYNLEIEWNYFDEKNDAKQIRRKRKELMNLNSP